MRDVDGRGGHDAPLPDPAPLRTRVGAVLTISVCVFQLLAAPAEATRGLAPSSVAAVMTTATLLPSAEGTAAIAEGTWMGYLNTVYSGHGTVDMTADALNLRPLAPVGPVLNGGASGYDTHAALVRGTTPIEGQQYTLQFSVATVQQLRVDGPAPWERAWLLFDYLDSTNYRYLILKDAGWEVGRLVDGQQEFSATGSDRAFPVGTVNRVRIVRQVGSVSIEVDGLPLADLAVSPLDPVSLASAVYSEDAQVQVDLWTVSDLLPRLAPAVASVPGSTTAGRSPAPAAPPG